MLWGLTRLALQAARRIRDGFGRVLGKVWEAKMLKKSDMLFEILILVDFCSICDNFDGGDGESKPVTGVCHGEEDRKASDICV